MDMSDQLQAQAALTPDVCKSRLYIGADSIGTNKFPILHIVYFPIKLLLHVSTQLSSSGSLNQCSQNVQKSSSFTIIMHIKCFLLVTS